MSSIRTKGDRTRQKSVGQRVPPQQKPSQSGLIREAIFGLNDGLVATIGLVSGEALSHQGHKAILIAGLSAIGAAMVSMAVGSYLATSSENDFMRKEVADQKEAIHRHPHRERHHVARILKSDIGVPLSNVPTVTENIVKSRPRWLNFMVRENLGIHQNRAEAPLKNSAVMAISVIIGSTPPVLPYLLPIALVEARNASWALSVMAALALGALKGHLTRTSLLRSAISFGILVSLSAVVGALIGFGLGQIGI